MPTPDLRIAHLYADLLNIYGDRGNILTLVQRAKWRGIPVSVVNIGLRTNSAPTNLSDFDLFFIGGGQDKQQQIIAEDLLARKQELIETLASGSVILSICGGYQLLGHYYRPHEGPELKGLSLLDAHTQAGNKRLIGNVAIERSDGTTLVGFENHSGKTYLGSDCRPLGKILKGNGNNGEDGFEGAQQGNIFGTYLHGSLLPKNPQFADQLLTKALARRHGDIQLAPLDDMLEQTAHKHALNFSA